jgi:hypothetical protein
MEMHPEHMVVQGQEAPQYMHVADDVPQVLPEQHTHMASDGQEVQRHMDQPMEGDDSMNTTITASTAVPLPADISASNGGYAPNNDHVQHNSGYAPNNNHALSNNAYAPPNDHIPTNSGYAPIQEHAPNNNGYAQNPNAYTPSPVVHQQNNNAYQQSPNAYPPNNNGYPNNNNAYAPNSNSHTPEPYRPSTSYSDTAYQYTTHNGSRFNTPSDADTPPRATYQDPSKDTHMGQSHSRPNSQMGRYPASEGNSRANSYQDQNQRTAQQPQQPPPEAPNKNASVVIKVGMVGDAQIGKTSLMVKYVEGSWDEDYIQTLGRPSF